MEKTMKKLLSVLLSVAMLLSLVPGIGLIASAADPVSYKNAAYDSATNTVTYTDATCDDYTAVAADTTTFEDGKWYVVNSNVTVNGSITVNGAANLILADGYKLTVTEGVAVTDPSSLTIFGQENGTGTLTATGGDDAAGIGGINDKSGPITINGGTVNATGDDNGGAGIGASDGNSCGDITINGGTVNASASGYSDMYGIGDAGWASNGDGTIAIHGGTVNVSVGEYTTGIGYRGNGTINITGGVVNVNKDKVSATGFKGTLNVSGGEVYAAGSVAVSGSANFTGGTFIAESIRDNNPPIQCPVSIASGLKVLLGSDEANAAEVEPSFVDYNSSEYWNASPKWIKIYLAPAPEPTVTWYAATENIQIGEDNNQLNPYDDSYTKDAITVSATSQEGHTYIDGTRFCEGFMGRLSGFVFTNSVANFSKIKLVFSDLSIASYNKFLDSEYNDDTHWSSDLDSKTVTWEGDSNSVGLYAYDVSGTLDRIEFTYEVPAPSAYADYLPAATDDATALAAKVVKFDDKDWYLIEDNSTAADAGTVTLFAKECVAASIFGGSSTYSGSTVEGVVNNYYTNSISTDAKTAVSGNGMFLLTTDQANAIKTANVDVLKCSQATGAESILWWLSSPYDDYNAVCVYGDNGSIRNDGEYVERTLGVRPALKLDLSKVEFDSGTKTFALPAPSAYAGYVPAETDDATALAAKVVKFNGYNWYIIEDNSTAADAGTVTLFAADTSFGTSSFDATDLDNKYSTSMVKTYLDGMTETGGAFADVADAIETVTVTTDNDTDVTAKLYLLSKSEAGALPVNVLMSDNFANADYSGSVYWLRSPNPNDGMQAAYVDCPNGTIYNGLEVYHTFGVRPALKLDLSKVAFDGATNTFALPAHVHSLTPHAAENAGCTTAGNSAYWSCSCGMYFSDENGETEIAENSWVIPALGHNYDNVPYSSDETYHWRVCARCSEESAHDHHTWGSALYVWGDNNSTVTASHGCVICGKQVSETVNTTTSVSGANCTEPERTTYTANFTKDGFVQQIKSGVQTGPSLGHNYENVAYSSDDTQHWKVCSRCNEDSEKQNHTWGEATYTWSADNSQVTARHTCTQCGKEVTETVDTTSQVTAAATCTTAELTTYTATFTKDGFVQQVKPDVQTEPATGHEFSYAGLNETITATCSHNGCEYHSNGAFIVIHAPALNTYGGAESASATLEGLDAFNAATGLSVSENAILYYNTKIDGMEILKDGLPLPSPAGAGTYWAEIKIQNATAYVVYTIAKANPTANDFIFSEPDNLNYNGNNKMATVIPQDGVDGMGDVTVRYYSDAARTNEVDYAKNAGTYYVGITVNEGDNYYAASAVLYDSSWKFTVAKANPTANDFIFSEPDNLNYNENNKMATVIPQDGVDGMGDVTVRYYSDAARTNEVDYAKNAGTYYVGITVNEGDNYNATSAVLYDSSWKFTVAKANPTYTAPDGLTAGYGDTLADVALPDGWTWEADLTTSVGNAGDNVFQAKFTPEDTDNYNVVEHVNVTVSVGKAASAAATVAANEWTFDGTAHALLAVTGDAVGGTMKYALGTAAAPGTFGDSIPEATDPDTYYVWYKVSGDANHNDTDAVLVTVTVAHDEALDAVIAAIDAIGPVTEVLADQKAKIDAARAGYNALTPEQQTLVTNYATLLGAEADYKALFVFDANTQITISGVEKYGETLTATAIDVPVFITDAVVRWYNSDGILIGTGETYTLTAAEIGKSVRAELYSAEANDTVTSDFTGLIGKGVIKNYTLPTAAHIMYPQTLADATLTGGDTGEITGTWAWVTPDAQPTSAQSGSSFELTFTPTGTYADLYEGFTTRLAVVVDPAPFEPQAIEDTASGLTFDADFAQNVEIELTDIAYSQSAYLALLRASKKDDSGMTRLVLLKTIVFTIDGEAADEAYTGAVTVTSYVGAKLAGRTVSVWFFIDGEPVNYVGTVGYDGVLVIENVAL